MEVAVPPAAGRRPAALSDESADARTSPRLFALIAMVVVVVGCLVTLGVVAFTRDDADGASGESQSDRDAIQQAAQQFALRLTTYGPGDLDQSNKMPDYVKRVDEVVTPKFAADFEQNVGLAEQTVAQTGIGRTTKVYATGVSEAGTDSATALVAGTFTNSYPSTEDPKKRVTFDAVVFRYQVSLVKTDGEWLVDNYQTITDLAAGEDGAPSELPSGFETGSPSAPAGGGSSGGSGSGVGGR